MRWIERIEAGLSSCLGPFGGGFVGGFVGVGLLATALAQLSAHFEVAHASAELLSALAQISVGLLIAFGVTIATVERGKSGRAEHVNWLGAGCGFAFAAFFGAGLCLAAQAYREAGHAGLFDLLAVTWSALSLALVGLVVCVGPLLIYRSRESHGE